MMVQDVTAAHERRMDALRKQESDLEGEILDKKKGIADRSQEDGHALAQAYRERRKLLADLRQTKDDLESADYADAPAKEKFDIQEAELRLEEIRQRMRHAEERHKAWLDHVEKHANAPMSFVRGGDGRIIGAK